MTEIVLFHHIQGLTPGVRAFADGLREAGHTVHTPDYFEGRTFDSIEEGAAHCREVGFDEMRRRGVRLAEDLPGDVVYGGFSLGVMAAQYLVQNRPGALGGLFYHGVIDPAEFGAWPSGVPAQVHAMDADPEFIDAGDLEAATPFLDSHDEVELFLYPGDGHLFTDSSLAAHDADATKLVLERSLELLDRVGR
ncbi:dienelactone hydrolase family protein [Phycicoccus sp. M110.8]|uniref:dienelactone hydrolase family protein n=1 Tax=Phycicoccus sp. M110.8 TaxID=3075433 RepID=UPI0028FD44B4|nr:dienelactone hydrolase family protein [Phycicoccus sp. M110.8]MDU0313777.1 dienelactone hydrolase family protein [Phycicoccus sp. M110.8]